jgi:hypothetical protein
VGLGVEDDRDRAVVRDLDDHPGAEHACLGGKAEVAELLAERFVQRFGHVGPGRFREVRPGSLLASAIRYERELADDERLAARVDDAPVEPALLVLEDPQAGDLAGETQGGRLVVSQRDAEEDAEPRADGGDGFPVDEDARLADPLDERSQFSRASSARW